MNWRMFGLSIEALAFGGPITVVALYFLSILFMATMMVPSSVPEKVKAGLIILSGLMALVEYWRLAWHTIRGCRYSFGIFFWIGLFGAFYATYFFSLIWSNEYVSLIFIAPVVAVTWHFAYLQLRYYKRKK